MQSKPIQNGKEIVEGFLASCAEDSSLDQTTLNIVVELFGASKLTKTRLLRALEDARQSAGAPLAGSEESGQK